MNGVQIKTAIIEKSKEIGIDKIGFCAASNFSHLEEGIKKQIEAGNVTGFEHPSLEERLYPEKIMRDAKTILSVCVAYPTKANKPFQQGKKKRGKFSRSSWGLDYHQILEARMKELIAFIKELAAELAPDFSCMVDTGPLIDVAVAARAGVGFIGKNGLLITEEFGSFVFLGEILTNLELPVDTPIENQCGTCARCVKFCPTNALIGNGKMRAKQCLSFQTQKKGMVELPYRKKMKTTLYGCDICQMVCPYNKGKDFHFHEEMAPVWDDIYPELHELLTLSNKAFQERFGKMAGSWRGKKVLQRNAIIALVNANDRKSLPFLKELAEKEEREEILATLIWAISELNQKESQVDRAWFESFLDSESELVCAEVRRILDPKNIVK